MVNKLIIKLPAYLILIIIAFSVLFITNTYANKSHKRHTSFKYQASVWKKVARHMNLKSYAHNEYVHEQIRRYLSHTSSLYKLTKNATPYISYVMAELKKRGMPLELALLPMIESNYNPKLVSNKGAAGLWQMMPSTALDLGIRINWWYDGRLDIVASTHAALDYLQYLHDYFKSWPLTFAAYNSGIGTVQKAIRYNRIRGLNTDYRSLPLPQQTKEYVPKIVAIATILSNPKIYRLPIHAVSNKRVFTSIKLHYPISIRKVARLSRCRVSTIRKLNPGFKRAKPAPNRTYHVLVPVSRVSRFKAKWAQYVLKVKANAIKNAVYTVKLGDSLSTIALQLHVTLLALRATNHLTSNLIKAGQSLYIPPSHRKA